jgi:protein ImuB
VRVACLLVPDLPLHAELRASPEWVGRPLVVVSGPGTRAEVLAASPEARAQGIRPKQTLPQVRALCPDTVVRVASPALERAAREALLDAALSLAPRAELAPRASGLFLAEGAVYVDASGIDALHESERAFASVLLARAERAGVPGVAGVAGSRGTARLVARHLVHTLSVPSIPVPGQAGADPAGAPTIRALPPDGELDFLAPLPIDLLDPDDHTAQTLTRFGLHHVRDLLRLPRRELATRLGPGLLALLARARGEEIEPPIAEPRVRSLEEGIDLEAPIDQLEPLAFVLRGLVSRLVERLRLRALGGDELRLELGLANGARESRRIGVASPCQDERVLLRLLRLALETRPPPDAVEQVVLGCEGVPLRREQLDFFLPRGPSPSALDQTLAELAVLCGADRVGSPERVDDHRPDAFALRPFERGPRRRGSDSARGRTPRARPPGPGARASEASGHTREPGTRASGSAGRGPRLTLRALRPPLRAEVRVEGGRPAFLRSAVSQGDVLCAAGPWRTTGHWWEKSTHFAVDHYDVQMDDGNVLRLCFDWRTRKWQIDGLYD